MVKNSEHLGLFFVTLRSFTRHGSGKATSLLKCRAPIRLGNLDDRTRRPAACRCRFHQFFPSFEHRPSPTIWIDQGGPHASASLALNIVWHWHLHWRLYFGHATTENERWSSGIQQRDRLRAGALRILGDVLKSRQVSLLYAISPASQPAILWSLARQIIVSREAGSEWD